jgi:hypothetical protein
MWFWFTNKIHEHLVIILFVIILGLLFFPTEKKGLAGAATASVGPLSDLAVYTTKGMIGLAQGIFEAMFN